MKKDKIAVIGLSGESNFYKVDHFNEIGETVSAYQYHKEYGGKGYNQAITIARMGCDVSYFTVYGNDSIKEECIKLLNKEGVLSNSVTKNGLSASASIIIDKKGENQVICFPGVSNNLSKYDVLLFEDEIKEAKYLLVQLELSLESTIQAIKLAKKYDTKVILNPAPACKLPLEILKDCYLLTPNEQEARTLFGFEINEQSILNVPLDNLVVTLGSKGCLLKEGSNVTIIPACKIAPLNTTGAGDVFNGTLVACLLKGKNLKEACKIANIAAGKSVQREFVIDAIPYAKEVNLE